MKIKNLVKDINHFNIDKVFDILNEFLHSDKKKKKTKKELKSKCSMKVDGIDNDPSIKIIYGDDELKETDIEASVKFEI